MTYDKACELAEAVLTCAIKDARGRTEGDREVAVLWLQSKSASLWLDILDIDHTVFLERINWRKMLADCNFANITNSQMAGIQPTLDRLPTHE